MISCGRNGITLLNATSTVGSASFNIRVVNSIGRADHDIVNLVQGRRAGVGHFSTLRRQMQQLRATV